MTIATTELKNITSRIYAKVLEQPDAPAYAFEDSEALTYAQLWSWVDEIRDRIAARGISRGNRVTVLVPVCRELVPLLLALFAEGITPVLIDPRLRRRSWLNAIRSSGSSFVLSAPTLMKIPWLWKSWLGVLGMNYRELVGTNPSTNRKPLPPVESQADDAVMASMTSGTTGPPKLILRNFSVTLAQQTLSNRHLPPLTVDRHATGYPVAGLLALTTGAFAILLRDHRTEVSWHSIQKHRPTRVSGSPAFMRELFESPALCSGEAAQLQCLMTGGAPLPRWLLRDLQAKCTSAKIWNIYGSTECEPIALTPVATQEGQIGYFVGDLIPELKMNSKKLGELRGLEFFEVQLQGENIPHGALSTGDLAHRDPSGALWLLGRKSEMVRGVPSGFLEEPLEGQMGIARLAVLEERGTVHAFVEMKTGAAASPQLRAKVEEHLETWGVGLDRFKILSALPVDRRHRWKIQREELRRRHL